MQGRTTKSLVVLSAMANWLMFFCRVRLSCADSGPTFSGPDVIAGRDGGRKKHCERSSEQAKAIKDGPIPLSQSFVKTASVLYVMRGPFFFFFLIIKGEEAKLV